MDDGWTMDEGRLGKTGKYEGIAEQMEQGQRQPQGVSKDAECPIGFVGGMPVQRHRTARSGMMEGRDRREAFGCGRVRVNRSWVC